MTQFPAPTGEIGQQPQRVQLTLRHGQEHLTGRRVREPGREQRETAPVAADDAELLTRQPGQPLPRNTTGLQQVNKPVPARGRGDLLADTPHEIRSPPAGPASHASTLPGQPSLGGRTRRGWRATTAVIPGAPRVRCATARPTTEHDRTADPQQRFCEQREQPGLRAGVGRDRHLGLRAPALRNASGWGSMMCRHGSISSESSV